MSAGYIEVMHVDANGNQDQSGAVTVARRDMQLFTFVFRESGKVVHSLHYRCPLHNIVELKTVDAGTAAHIMRSELFYHQAVSVADTAVAEPLTADDMAEMIAQAQQLPEVER